MSGSCSVHVWHELHQKCSILVRANAKKNPESVEPCNDMTYIVGLSAFEEILYIVIVILNAYVHRLLRGIEDRNEVHAFVR